MKAISYYNIKNIVVLRQILDTKAQRYQNSLICWERSVQDSKNTVYDEDFKKMIVELYENKTTTAANIVREYGIGSTTLYKWVGLYGKIQTTDGETINNK